MRSPIGEMIRTGGGTAAAVIDDVMSKVQPQPALTQPPQTRVRQQSPGESPESSSVDEVLDESFPASDPPSWTGAISRVAAPANVSFARSGPSISRCLDSVSRSNKRSASGRWSRGCVQPC